MKKLLCLILVLCMMIPFTGCAAKPFEVTEEKTNYVCLAVEYTDAKGKEHITVANFQMLVAKGFYDGLTFHRVVKNFVIQAGCPYGTGLGGNTDENGQEINITGEFAANGIDTGLQHVRGTVSMARNGYDYNSASSQFFIVHTTSAKNSYSLDDNYAAFGHVVYGIEHVDGIAAVSNNPANNKPYKPVTIVSADFVNITGDLD